MKQTQIWILKCTGHANCPLRFWYLLSELFAYALSEHNQLIKIFFALLSRSATNRKTSSLTVPPSQMHEIGFVPLRLLRPFSPHPTLSCEERISPRVADTASIISAMPVSSHGLWDEARLLFIYFLFSYNLVLWNVILSSCTIICKGDTGIFLLPIHCDGLRVQRLHSGLNKGICFPP